MYSATRSTTEQTPLVQTPLVAGAPSGGSLASPLQNLLRRIDRGTAIALVFGATCLAQPLKSLADNALSSSSALIQQTTGVKSVITTLPGLGTAIYAIGKIFGILYGAKVGSRCSMLLATGSDLE